ncbi:hypothetical protein B2H94_09105 [Clostridium sporogenes]|uniref:Uncharacterized protein n=1 Tax=Clostridium sporogenes TaxID=1509 RepID=A0ABD6S0D9_CLOSG|nr:hypothetical protein [Clostridium sporogenes]OSB19239.1 hypothetical protein B2H94_09105 [Clostridium sporogenes]
MLFLIIVLVILGDKKETKQIKESNKKLEGKQETKKCINKKDIVKKSIKDNPDLFKLNESTQEIEGWLQIRIGQKVKDTIYF